MLGTVLKRELDNRGIKYTFVSKMTGISYVSLLQYLSGHREMPESKLRCVAMTFHIDLKIFGLSEINSVQAEKEPA